jgi:hypothetical protein
MADYNRSEFPRLDLVFAADGGHPFLHDATFWDKHGKVSKKLVNEQTSGKYLRALCICIILAKYRGDHGNPKEPIVMHESSRENSWLNSIGGSFGKTAQFNFFFEYFGGSELDSGLDFILVKRGGGHNKRPGGVRRGSLPSIAYDPMKLPLQNVNLSKMESDKGRPVPLQKSDLPPMAETLEKYTRELKEQWRPFVSELVRGFDSEILRSKDSENSSKQEQAELQPT